MFNIVVQCPHDSVLSDYRSTTLVMAKVCIEEYWGQPIRFMAPDNLTSFGQVREYSIIDFLLRSR